jgi:hypothetical protein
MAAPPGLSRSTDRPPCRSSEGKILGASLEGGPSEGPGGRLAELETGLSGKFSLLPVLTMSFAF